MQTGLRIAPVLQREPAEAHGKPEGAALSGPFGHNGLPLEEGLELFGAEGGEGGAGREELLERGGGHLCREYGLPLPVVERDGRIGIARVQQAHHADERVLRVVHEFHLPSPNGRRGEFEEVVGFEVEFGLSAKDVFRFGGEPAVVEVEQVEAGGGVEQREHFAGHGGEKAVDGLCLGTRGEQEQVL